MAGTDEPGDHAGEVRFGSPIRSRRRVQLSRSRARRASGPGRHRSCCPGRSKGPPTGVFLLPAKQAHERDLLPGEQPTSPRPADARRPSCHLPWSYEVAIDSIRGATRGAPPHAHQRSRAAARARCRRRARGVRVHAGHDVVRGESPGVRTATPGRARRVPARVRPAVADRPPALSRRGAADHGRLGAALHDARLSARPALPRDDHRAVRRVRRRPTPGGVRGPGDRLHRVRLDLAAGDLPGDQRPRARARSGRVAARARGHRRDAPAAQGVSRRGGAAGARAVARSGRGRAAPGGRRTAADRTRVARRARAPHLADERAGVGGPGAHGLVAGAGPRGADRGQVREPRGAGRAALGVGDSQGRFGRPVRSRRCAARAHGGPGPSRRPHRAHVGRRSDGPGRARRHAPAAHRAGGPGGVPHRAGGPDEHAAARGRERGRRAGGLRPDGVGRRDPRQRPRPGRRTSAGARRRAHLRWQRAARHAAAGAALGGHCVAGPVPGRGFHVQAHLPYGDRPTGHDDERPSTPEPAATGGGTTKPIEGDG